MRTIVFKSRSWWKSEWDILRDDQPVGEFVVTKKISYNAARAKAESHEWAFEATTWTGAKHLVKDASGNTVASAESISWWRYDIAIEHAGKRYTMKPSNWLWTRYSITDESGRIIMEVRPSLWNNSAIVEIKDLSLDPGALYVLACIAFYRAKIIEMQSSAVAGSGGAVVVAGS